MFINQWHPKVKQLVVALEFRICWHWSCSCSADVFLAIRLPNERMNLRWVAQNYVDHCHRCLFAYWPSQLSVSLRVPRIPVDCPGYFGPTSHQTNNDHLVSACDYWRQLGTRIRQNQQSDESEMARMTHHFGCRGRNLTGRGLLESDSHPSLLVVENCFSNRFVR